MTDSSNAQPITEPTDAELRRLARALFGTGGTDDDTKENA